MSIKCHFLHSISHICIHLLVLILTLNCYIILIKGLPHHHPETIPDLFPSFSRENNSVVTDAMKMKLLFKVTKIP